MSLSRRVPIAPLSERRLSGAPNVLEISLTPASPSQSLVDSVERFLLRHGVLTGDGSDPGSLVVAFSGGPDSTALLWTLVQVATRRPLRLVAAHLDHAGDPGSAARARHAAALAERLGVECVVERQAPKATGAGPEAAARSARYAFLRRCLEAAGASHVAVGHHRDDQLATIVLRLLQGSGPSGLGAMRAAHGDLLRPLLDVDRATLVDVLDAAGLEATADPGNDDLARPRNRVEAHLLPWLRRQPGVDDALLLRVAAAAQGAGDRLRRDLTTRLAIGGGGSAPARLRRDAFARLPEPLRPFALDALRRRAGRPYPAPRAAQRELDRQLAAGGAIGCDCGDGWRWREAGEWLELVPGEPVGAARGTQPEVPEFSYRLRVPGELQIPETGQIVRVLERQAAPWMFRGAKTRAALALSIEDGDYVSIRNRRPGDRLRPLGCAYERKLKDVLIDRRVDRARRDALPLLVVGGRIAWVPGVTIDDRFRLPETDAADRGNQTAWVAELLEDDPHRRPRPHGRETAAST